LSADLWTMATTTVGLVSVRCPGGVNVMAAEWTYLVSKRPPHVAVVLADGAWTPELIGAAGEFSVTLCAASQAALADFVGSMSGREIDKSGCTGLVLEAPTVTGTPWAGGGVVAVECLVRQVVPLPGYRMFVGEVVAEHRPSVPAQPLVKHGGMYALGERLPYGRVVCAAQVLDPYAARLRVAATGGGADPGAPFRVSLVLDGEVVVLGTVPAGEWGDVLVELDAPRGCPPHRLVGAELLVERDGVRPGRTRIRGAARERAAG
jgi:flavin reductase (DIM6/NTAB) family NADH-FMN oxidoreductase RutF